jgi:hypothetical protein
MCPHFAVGKCFYGNNCKYKHPGQLPNTNLYPYSLGQPLPYDANPSLLLNHLGYPGPNHPLLLSHGALPNMGMLLSFVWRCF